MKIINTALATSLTVVLATAAAAQTTTTPPTTTETEPTTTETTTTQTELTTTPDGQPAITTTQTTTTETQVTAATAEDIKAGVSVFDQSGGLVGKVDSVKGEGAIVNTGEARAEIPLTSFGKNDKGLVVSITKADLDAKAKEKSKPKS